MPLEEKLSKIDEEILAQYTKLSKNLGLDEGRRKYYAGLFLQINSAFLCVLDTNFFNNLKMLGIAEASIRGGLCSPDYLYNLKGTFGKINESEVTQGTKSIDADIENYKNWNRKVRLPMFAVGTGFIIKYSYDFLTNNLNENSNFYLLYGLGLLSQASSMYLKETDPKLLNKEPIWKRIYNKITEEIDSLVPKPQLRPIPIRKN